jgi:hypothetical protein
LKIENGKLKTEEDEELVEMFRWAGWKLRMGDFVCGPPVVGMRLMLLRSVIGQSPLSRLEDLSLMILQGNPVGIVASFFREENGASAETGQVSG